MNPIPTSELESFLPHRPPMVWVDEVVSFTNDSEGERGVCRVFLSRDRSFFGADGVRASALVEWIAQSYGFVKSCTRRAGGLDAAPGQVFLVGLNDVDVDMGGLANEKSVLVHVREQRNLHPAYLLEGSVTSEDGVRCFGRARMKVFAGDLPAGKA